LKFGVNSPSLFASQSIVNIISTKGMARAEAFFQDNKIRKFNFAAAYTNPVLHVTELKLIRAEAAAELNQDLQTAMNDLNDIRTRAGEDAFALTTNTAFIIENVRAEREVELYFENSSFCDLKRQAVRNKPDLTIRGALWSCPGMVNQLPNSELKGNPEMEPNAQGGCN